MTATLYLPQKTPRPVLTEGLMLSNPTSGFVSIPTAIPELLSCAPELVDVLASGASYTVYTVFDSEEEANPTATQIVAELTDIDFDAASEDELLRGPVLIVKL
jgi:hypothetical protein